jgi:hypothetical protein
VAFAPPTIDNDLSHLIEANKNKEIRRIMTAMAITESGYRYDMKGSSGEYGAWQVMPKTWERWCDYYFKEQLEMTPFNQELVVWLRVERLVDKGYCVKQIASIWNSGSPNWQGKKGVNWLGIRYDTPHHVKKVYKNYLNNEPMCKLFDI